MEQTIVSKQTRFVNEESKILRECRARRMAISRSVYKILDTQINYYVKSESKDRYYFVEYKTDSQFCTCWDYASHRSDKCKHILAVEYAIHLGLVQKIDHKLPISQVKKNINTIAEQYKDYSIATLNELEKAEIEEAEQYSSKAHRQHRRWEDDSYDF